jgi:transposase
MTALTWLLTLAFLVTLAMSAVYREALGEQKKRCQQLDAQYRTLYEHYERYRSAYQSLAKTTPPEHREKDEDARAVRDYRGLAEQYRAMIDELYGFGEQIAQRHKHGQESLATQQVQQRGSSDE